MTAKKRSNEKPIDPDFIEEELERINRLKKEFDEAEKTQPSLEFFKGVKKEYVEVVDPDTGKEVVDPDTGDVQKILKITKHAPNLDAFVNAITRKYYPVNTGGERGVLFNYKNGKFYHKDVELDINKEFNRLWKASRPKHSNITEHTPSKVRKEFYNQLRMARFLKKEKFNELPDLINCKNGFLFLDTNTKNSKHRLLGHNKHTPYTHPSTRQFNADWDPDATYPTWQKFLDFIMPDLQQQLQLQEVAGFLLDPEYSIEVSALLIGTGRNGKDTFVRVLTEICGGADNITAVTLKEISRNTFAAFNLFGKIGNIVGEASKDLLKYTEMFKKLNGNSLIFGNIKNKEPINFYNKAKHIIQTNEYPEVTDHTVAFWERWLVIDFNTYIPRNKRISGFYKTLLKERSGILNWMIEGYLRLIENGQFTEKDDAKKEWRGLTDIYLNFVEEVFINTPKTDDTIPTKEAYELFKDWLRKTGRKKRSEVTFCRNIYKPVYGTKRFRPGGSSGPYHIANLDDSIGIIIDYEAVLRIKGQEVVYTKDPDSLLLE